MKNNNIKCIVPLWDLESYETPDDLYIIEYDEQEFIEHEDNEDGFTLEDRMIEGEKFKHAMRPISDDDSHCCKATWSISRLLQHAKDSGLQPDWVPEK